MAQRICWWKTTSHEEYGFASCCQVLWKVIRL